MTAPSDRRSRNQDPGFEVVGQPDETGSPLPVAKAVPVQPGTPVRKASPVPADSKKPKVQLVEEADTLSQKKRTAATPAPTERTPRQRLSGKDRKRIRKEMARERAAEWEQEKQEWVVPLVLIAFGLLFMFGSAGYLATRSPNAATGAAVLLAACFAYILVMVPVAVMMMIVIGKLAGIDYGSLRHVLRTLGAFLFFLVGIYFASSAFLNEAALLITPPIATLIGYVMFMKFFGLDVEDARTSTFIVNVITWVGNLLFQTMVVMFFLTADDGSQLDPDAEYYDREIPAWVDDGGTGNEPEPDERTPGVAPQRQPGTFPARNR